MPLLARTRGLGFRPGLACKQKIGFMTTFARKFSLGFISSVATLNYNHMRAYVNKKLRIIFWWLIILSDTPYLF